MRTTRAARAVEVGETLPHFVWIGPMSTNARGWPLPRTSQNFPLSVSRACPACRTLRQIGVHDYNRRNGPRPEPNANDRPQPCPEPRPESRQELRREERPAGSRRDMGCAATLARRARWPREQVQHRHPAAERDGCVALRSRAQQHAAGHPDPLPPHARRQHRAGCPAPTTPASRRRRSSTSDCRARESPH